MKRFLCNSVTILFQLALGCSSKSSDTATSNGGKTSTVATVVGGASGAGSLRTGGTMGLGGHANTGGNTSLATSVLGGTTGNGGTSSRGGAIATGGNMPTGGTRTTGGASGTSGAIATGGNMPTGGTKTTGGTSAIASAQGTGGNSSGVGGTGGATTSSLLPLTGAHVLAQANITANTSLTTSPINTQTSGSTIIVGVGRGARSGLVTVPSDNKGNKSFVQLGQSTAYVGYPDSGAALYALTNAVGGTGHTFTVSNVDSDEVTIAAVEVRNSSVVQDSKGAYVAGTTSFTSPSVTTTGPATIVAFCWGDSAGATNITGVNNSFKVLDQYSAANGISVQGASASRDVSAAGTYNVTWTVNPAQVSGAILYIVAVQ